MDHQHHTFGYYGQPFPGEQPQTPDDPAGWSPLQQPSMGDYGSSLTNALGDRPACGQQKPYTLPADAQMTCEMLPLPMDSLSMLGDARLTYGVGGVGGSGANVSATHPVLVQCLYGLSIGSKHLPCWDNCRDGEPRPALPQ
jgi:hypothetical protein